MGNGNFKLPFLSREVKEIDKYEDKTPNIKYYFKSSKVKKVVKEEVKEETSNTNQDLNENLKPMQVYTSEKEFYSIEDLITIYSIFERGEKYCKNLSLDIKAMEAKLKNYEAKVKNASLYISEIDKHKKSIFEFWKFSNKDEKNYL